MIGAAYRALVARCYDLWFSPAEAAGLSKLRAEQLRPAAGRVLELGAGTGLNLSHYPHGIDELVLTEPDPHMVRRLDRRRRSSPAGHRLLRVPGEALPFDEGAFDAVVSTFVLCTVDDPDRALAEARRVLRPGGTLLFLEHVRSSDPALARWQDRLAPAWRVVSAGCRCNQDTLAHVRAAGFELGRLRRGGLPMAPPLWRPYVLGAAASS